MPEPGERFTRIAFWCLLAAGAALRIAHFLQVQDAFLFRIPVFDAAYYDDWAREIARGDWIGAGRGVFTMSPGYPYFLAALYAVFGFNVEAVVVVQFLLGLATGALVFRLGRAAFGPGAGLVAMAFHLFSASQLFFEGTLLKPVLINFVNVLALCLAGGGSVGALLSGVLLGFSAHLRPTALALLPLVCIWLWRRRRAAGGRGRRALLPPAAACAGALLALLPVAARNFAVGGEFVLTTAHGGMNFYTGNAPYALGPYTPAPFARTDPKVEQADFLAEARRRSGRELTPGAASDFWYREALTHIRENPIAWGKLMLRKVIVLFNRYEFAVNLDPDFFRELYPSVLSAPLLTYGALLPLALAGIAFAPAHFLYLGYLAVYFLLGVVFFSAAEYRFPVVPVLCVYAGAACAILVRAWRSGNRRRLAAVAACALLGAAFVNFDWYTHVFGFKNYTVVSRANSYFMLGVTYERERRPRDAEEAYRRTLAIWPFVPAMTYLGYLRENQGDLVEAQHLFERALAADPTVADSHADLGHMLLKRGEPARAAGAFRRALALQPGLRRAEDGLRAALAAGAPRSP